MFSKGSLFFRLASYNAIAVGSVGSCTRGLIPSTHFLTPSRRRLTSFPHQGGQSAEHTPECCCYCARLHTSPPNHAPNVRCWPCAPKARITCGGGIHPE